jgi:uncharacterized membrane protein YdjX (TVP38/TMEM64 family)
MGLGRPLLLIAVVLAIPILPFLGLGESFEARLSDWFDAAMSPGTAAGLVIGMLASDILLPVPSSVVSTFAGKVLGFWAGTAAIWCGMTAGSVVAFWLVRLGGRPLARRLSGEASLRQIDELAQRYGALVLVLARPVPVFAEASVLLMGTSQLAWWRFLLAVGLSNLGVSAAYAALGDRVQFPVAVAASIALPLLAAAIARWCWPAQPSPPS